MSYKVELDEMDNDKFADYMKITHAFKLLISVRVKNPDKFKFNKQEKEAVESLKQSVDYYLETYK